MKELDQLDSRAEELPFAVWAVSASSRAEAKEMSDRFVDTPFRFIADETLGMIRAFGVTHEGGGPGGEDIAYPTLILVDETGAIRWSHRAARNTDRLPVDDLLEQARALLEG